MKTLACRRTGGGGRPSLVGAFLMAAAWGTPTDAGAQTDAGGVEEVPGEASGAPDGDVDAAEGDGGDGEAGDPDRAPDAARDLTPPPSEPLPDAADELTVPPEPVPGRAVVEHEPGSLLPPEWRQRPAPPPPRAVVDRGTKLPGDVVARPITLPRGTFVFGFDMTSVFLDATPLTTFIPGFAVGVTRALEIGVNAPTRFDAGEQAWTSLDPAFRAAYTVFDEATVEIAAAATALAPVSSDAAPFLDLGVPILWHAHRRIRVDSGVGVELAFDDAVESVLRVPLGLTVQAAPWLFVGAKGVADVALSSGRTTGVDGELVVGLTVQSGGQGYFDVVGRFFVVDLGAGNDGQLSNGAGFQGGVRFYPKAF